MAPHQAVKFSARPVSLLRRLALGLAPAGPNPKDTGALDAYKYAKLNTSVDQAAGPNQALVHAVAKVVMVLAVA